MKKRVLSLILAAVLVCALAVPAMAAGKTVVETIPCGIYDHIWNDCDDGYGIVRVVIGGDERGAGGKVGFANREGQLLTPCKYEAMRDDTGRFVNGFEPVYLNRNGKLWCGVIDTTGKEVIPCTIDNGGYVPYFSDGFAPVHTGDYETGKYGFIDITGKVIVPYKYDRAWYAVEGLAPVALKSGEKDQYGNPIYKWGFVDKSGREVVPCKYDGDFYFSERSGFSEGLARVELNGKCGFIDKTGKEVIPCKYDGAHAFSEGLAAVSMNGKQGYIDKTGKMVIPCKYDRTENFANGLAAVAIDSGKKDEWDHTIYKWGFVDKTGREVVPCKYSEVKECSEGLTAVALDSGEKEPWGERILKWGYVDKTGKEVIPCEYYQAHDFYDGLAIAWKKNDQHAYYINKTGKVAIDGSFDDVKDFHNGFALVEKDEKWGVIDTTGKLVLDYQYDNARYERRGFHDGMAEVRRNGKVGLIAIVDSSRVAFTSTQTVEVDGKKVAFQCYALKDAAGNDTNYIKLRDLADILNGSAAQFEVGWDGQVTVTTGQGYTKNGSEQKTPFSGNRMYKEVTAQTMVDGKAADLAAFTLTDDNGGGYTYYKLRDLGTALGFKVDWTAQRGIYIETK